MICGYGIYQGIEKMTIKEAWKKFGPNNGCDSYASFKDKLGVYNKSIEDDKTIGAICLSDVVFFDDNNFIDLDLINVEWHNCIVKFKRYYNEDPIISCHQINNTENFRLIPKAPKKKKHSETTQREGQSEFRQKVASAYCHKCCITGESCADLLEAAHIQGYISKESNHIQNGLLLRVDLHKMFDSGLLAIEENYRVIVSKIVTSEYYQSFNGKPISLPCDKYNHPSTDALKLKIKELR